MFIPTAAQFLGNGVTRTSRIICQIRLSMPWASFQCTFGRGRGGGHERPCFSKLTGKHSHRRCDHPALQTVVKRAFKFAVDSLQVLLASHVRRQPGKQRGTMKHHHDGRGALGQERVDKLSHPPGVGLFGAELDPPSDSQPIDDASYAKPAQPRSRCDPQDRLGTGEVGPAETNRNRNFEQGGLRGLRCQVTGVRCQGTGTLPRTSHLAPLAGPQRS